jgi:hypothetical protein
MNKPSLEYIKKNYEGMISNNQLDRLNYLASLVPNNGLILEIGPYKGRSTSAIACGMKDSVHLITIDAHMLSKDGGKGYSGDNYSSIETVIEFRKNIEPWQQQITYMMAWPHNVSKYLLKDKFIDMIFIDCVKDYNSLYPIWNEFLPKCKNIVCSHDSEPDCTKKFYYPGVIRIINELIKPITKDYHQVESLFSAFIK